MVFKRYVQVGRAVIVNFGPDVDRLAVIVQIIDQNRVLVDGANIARQSIPLSWLSLTDLTIPLMGGARTTTVQKAIVKGELAKKWDASSWAKKRALRAKKASLSDFQRFSTMILTKRHNYTLRKEAAKLRTKAK